MGKIFIVGFGSAGYAALMAARRADPKADISVLDPKQEDLMHPCGLPYALEGHVHDEHLTQMIHLNRMGVEKIRARCLRIDPASGLIHAEAESGSLEMPYGAVILCTGSRPIMPPISGAAEAMGNGLYTLTTVKDLPKIRERIAIAGAGVVIGAGAIGLETAIALKEYLPVVTVLEMKAQVLPGVLDPDMSKTVEAHLAELGLDIRLSSAAEEILVGNGFAGVVAAGTRIDAELGILSTGFRANTEVAERSGIACADYGIRVDETLSTSVHGIYAAGDCISTWSVLDKRHIPAKLATSAYKQGTVAGLNAAGTGTVYRGTTGTFVTKIGTLEIAGTGYTTETARAHGFDPVAGKISSNYLPEYFPGGSQVTLKILCDRSSGLIIGAQAIGERGAAERINLISMALEFEIPAAEFGRVELAYCPSVSEVHDPLFKAVEFAMRRMAR